MRAVEVGRVVLGELLGELLYIYRADGSESPYPLRSFCSVALPRRAHAYAGHNEFEGIKSKMKLD